MTDYIGKPIPRPTVKVPLKGRRLEALRLVAQGYSSAQIALRMEITKCTADEHVAQAMVALEGRTRAHAVAIAFRLHLLD